MYELKQVRVKLKEESPLYSSEPIASPEDAIRIMGEALSDMDREYCCVVNLDNRNRPINFNIVSIGDINSTVVPMQNIFKTAILSNAATIFLVHNHIGKDAVLTPSREDELITEKLVYAGKIMNINVLDHVIVGGNEGKYYSFRENKDELFQASSVQVSDAALFDKTSRREQMKEITDQLEAGFDKFLNSASYKKLITTMAKFYKYSFNNNLLIAMQAPEATRVAGYSSWKKNFNRQVRKGEKAIKIIAPMTLRGEHEVEKIDPATQEVMIGSDGQPVTETKEYSFQRFRVVNVFDVAQTFGDPLPTLEVPELTGSHDHYEVFLEAVKKVSPVPMRFDEIAGDAKGYYDISKKEIVIQKGMSETQTMKTAVHELGHALCHDKDILQSLGEKKDRVTMELEAESIANCVSAFFGLDTSSYTYPYLAGWAADRPREALRESMDLIRTTSGKIVDEMMEVFKEKGIIVEKELAETTIANQKKEDRFEIFQINPGGNAVSQMFMGMDYLKEHDLQVKLEDYHKVYEGNLPEGMSLDMIYETFNIHRPEDFHGHSLSVSDIVVMSRGGEKKGYFVDTIGFNEIPDLYKGPDQDKTKFRKTDTVKEPLKTAEGKEAAIQL